MDKREEVVRFQLRKRKLSLKKILTTKRFHMTRGVKIRWVFFTLKNLKNRSELGKIFYFRLISGFVPFLVFFKRHKLV